MDKGAEAEFVRFAAGCLELRVGHGLRAAFPNAFRGKELDEVRTLLFPLIDERAKLAGTSAVGRERLERGENARPRNRTAGDGVAEVFVVGRPRTLDRGEAGVEDVDCVVDAVEDRLEGRLTGTGQPAVVEVPEDVLVRVDEAGRDRAVAQVVDDRVGGDRSPDASDGRAFDNDGRAVQRPAGAVEDRVGDKRNRARLLCEG